MEEWVGAYTHTLSQNTNRRGGCFYFQSGKRYALRSERSELRMNERTGKGREGKTGSLGPPLIISCSPSTLNPSLPLFYCCLLPAAYCTYLPYRPHKDSPPHIHFLMVHIAWSSRRFCLWQLDGMDALLLLLLPVVYLMLNPLLPWPRSAWQGVSYSDVHVSLKARTFYSLPSPHHTSRLLLCFCVPLLAWLFGMEEYVG